MKLRVAFGILLGLVGLYAVMGILQAASLFTGARALSNFNFWTSVAFLAYAASLAVLTRPWRFISRLPSVLLAAAASFFAVVGLVLAQPMVGEFLAVDSCLDSGGSFDYVKSVCDHIGNHPFVAIGWRSGFRLLVSVSCVAGGITLASLLVSRVRSNNSFKPNPLRSFKTPSGSSGGSA